MPVSIRHVFSLFFTSVFFSSVAVAQAPNVTEILTHLSESVRSKNYSGRLTYEHSGKLEVIEISHGVREGIEYERVTYLNGPEREVHNSGKLADCRSIGGHLLGGGMVRSGNGDSLQLNKFYDYRLLGAERVAGHLSWLLQLVPKDSHRHSMILAVDQQSYLPMKSMFVANGRKVLERLHFVSLEADTLFDESLAVHSEQEIRTGECPEKIAVESEALWRPQWVPDGFVLSRYQYTDEDGHIETYTDGLASFSIFVKLKVDSHDLNEGVSSLSAGIKKGATVVVLRQLSSASSPVDVAVLGEIPQATAKQILASIRQR